MLHASCTSSFFSPSTLPAGCVGVGEKLGILTFLHFPSEPGGLSLPPQILSSAFHRLSNPWDPQEKGELATAGCSQGPGSHVTAKGNSTSSCGPLGQVPWASGRLAGKGAHRDLHPALPAPDTTMGRPRPPLPLPQPLPPQPSARGVSLHCPQPPPARPTGGTLHL